MKKIELLKAGVLEVIDESLDEIFGIGKKRVIYYYVEKISGIRREDIPENFEKFLESLENLFGGGAELIKKVIMKKLEEDPSMDGRLLA